MEGIDPPLSRSDKIWYREGTIVIRAETTLFRFYQGFLEKRSPFFKDLFSIPQPEGAETVEGCPIVRVEDKAAEVEWLLLALEDTKTYDELSSRNHAVVVGCLRLATKYQFNVLREHIVNNLLIDCPTTQKAWKAIGNSDRRGYWDHNRFFQLACLVCELDLPSVLLPTLLCDLCTFDVGGILAAFVASAPCMSTPIREKVLQMSLLGMERLVDEKHDMICTLQDRLPDCIDDNTACQAKHEVWILDLHEVIRIECTAQEVFYSDMTDRLPSDSPCTACKNFAQELLEELRDTAWRMLPHTFRLLPPYGEGDKPPSAQHLRDDEYMWLSDWEELEHYPGGQYHPTRWQKLF